MTTSSITAERERQALAAAAATQKLPDQRTGVLLRWDVVVRIAEVAVLAFVEGEYRQNASGSDR